MSLDGADARHLVGESGREETPLRPLDDGASTQRWARTPARGSRRRLGRTLSSAARRSLGVTRCGAEEGAEERNEARVCATEPELVLFGQEPHAAVGLRWMAHDHRTEIQPRWEESFSAQAQVAAWSTGRAERERAGGPFSVSGRMTAWHGERGLRKSGPQAVFGFGPLGGLAHGEDSMRAGRGPISFSGQILQ
jgi:hypothetical protein